MHCEQQFSTGTAETGLWMSAPPASSVSCIGGRKRSQLEELAMTRTAKATSKRTAKAVNAESASQAAVLST